MTAHKNILLEVCANSVNSAVAAQLGGAARVELCENLSAGGTTPSLGQILTARKLLHIKLFVLIRPRMGDYVYTETDYDIIKADVHNCIDTRCDGIVIGMLHADGTIDKPRCLELVQMAKKAGMGITFHRAFDVCADMDQALEDIIELGCDRILTSGGKSTAIEGADILAQLVKKAAGRIHIMAGSGVNEHNAGALVHNTGVSEIHSSARKMITSGMHYRGDNAAPGNIPDSEFNYDETDAERVKAILKAVNG